MHCCLPLGKSVVFCFGMADPQEMKRVMGYLIGCRLGGQILPQMVPGLEVGDILDEALAQGVRDGMSGSVDQNLLQGHVEECQREFMRMLRDRSEARGKANLEAGQCYMQENGKKAGVTTTASGLQYEVLETGREERYDAAVHGEAPTAEVMYKGMLIDGTVFDQSQKPVKFNIRQVIPGFTEALKLMPIGATWRVTIPASLAYGEQGPGRIGPNSTLIFEMTLLGLSK